MREGGGAFKRHKKKFGNKLTINDLKGSDVGYVVRKPLSLKVIICTSLKTYSLPIQDVGTLIWKKWGGEALISGGGL